MDDVELIVALALHRRMTEAELRHALGDRIYDAFAPNGLLTQHDAEDPDNLLHLGLTDHGEDVEINKRAAESRPARLRQHQPGGHGRGPQERGHGTRQLQEPAPPPQPRDDAALQVVHGPAPLRAAHRQLAHGPADQASAASRCSRSRRPSTTTPSPAAFQFLQKREWEWKAKDRLGLRGRLDRPRPGTRPATPAGSSTRCGRPTG